MTQETEKFLNAEKSAEKLIQSLTALDRETSSYQTATRELNEVRQKLVSLIQSTQEIAKLTLESVVVLKTIGGPEILTRLAALTTQVQEHEKINEAHRGNIKKLIIAVLVILIITLVVGFVRL